VVLDSALDIDVKAKIFEAGPVLIVAATDLSNHAAKIAELQARGAEVVAQPGSFKEGRPKTDLHAVMKMLFERGWSEVHVEAGGKLNGSLLREGLVDELLLYVAPSLIGAGQPFADLPEVTSLSQKHEFEFIAVDRIGEDIRLRARRKDSFMKA
jgi:diaminohydroxyphosphoribosylaminopyrimidine deaminase / 5-amino-6-(5-phosphoribosylamino)uracil reductase